MRPFRLGTVFVLTGVCAVQACAVQGELPGELVGVYAIEGALTKNECGDEALPAADPLAFDVELRREDGTGYWLQGMPPARSGLLSNDGHFSFEIEQSYDVDPKARRPPDPFSDMDPEALADPEAFQAFDDRPAMVPCRLRIVESVEGTVLHGLRGDEPNPSVSWDDAADDTDADAADLMADNSIVISTETGFDCGLVMREEGGPFDALPCTAHYDLVGTMLRDEKK